jgi:hypothetical protein
MTDLEPLIRALTAVPPTASADLIVTSDDGNTVFRLTPRLAVIVLGLIGEEAA